MADTSKRWQVYIPTGGKPADTLALLRDADIIDLVDNELGPLQVGFYRDIDTNLPVEFARFRSGEASELVLQVTEEAAVGIDRLRRADCPVPIQRRLCSAGGAWEEVEHYGLAQFGQRGGSSLTANGTDARDDLPAVRFPATYRSGERYKWDKSTPIQWDVGSGDDNAPIGIIYCDDPACAGCGDGCQQLFAVFTNGTDNFVFAASQDGGKTWEVESETLSIGVPTALYCYYGRIFLAFSDGAVLYADTPFEFGDGFAPADLSEIPTGVPAPNLRRFAHPAKSSIKVLYAIYYAGAAPAGNNGIAISYDNGANWEEALARTADADIVLYDIAAAGSWVVAVGQDAASCYLAYSDDVGESFSTYTVALGGLTAVAVAMDLPNPFFAGDPVIYLLLRDGATDSLRLYKTTGADIGDSSKWVLKWADTLTTSVTGGTQFNLYTTAAGYLLWMHLPSISPDIAYIWKSIDGGATFVEMTQNITMDDIYGDRFAVCPTDGNRAIIMGGDRP